MIGNLKADHCGIREMHIYLFSACIITSTLVRDNRRERSQIKKQTLMFLIWCTVQRFQEIKTMLWERNTADYITDWISSRKDINIYFFLAKMFMARCFLIGIFPEEINQALKIKYMGFHKLWSLLCLYMHVHIPRNFIANSGIFSAQLQYLDLNPWED